MPAPTAPKKIYKLNPSMCGIGGARARIVGGEDASLGEWPWQGHFIHYQGKGECGASVLNEKFFLTAAHCIVDNNPKHWIVKVASLNRNSTDKYEDTYRINKIIVHKKYDKANYKNDIALLEVKGEIKFSPYVRPICIPSQGSQYQEDFKCYVTGYGLTKERGKVAKVLQKLKMPLVNVAKC